MPALLTWQRVGSWVQALRIALLLPLLWLMHLQQCLTPPPKSLRLQVASFFTVAYHVWQSLGPSKPLYIPSLAPLSPALPGLHAQFPHRLGYVNSREAWEPDSLCQD